MERKIRILLVDDKFERRQEFKKLLEDEGNKVTVSTEGQSALVKLMSKRKIKFHLVLTDTKMPCLTGPELVKEMKDRRIWIPVIGMSNREENRLLYENFWNKNEPREILLAMIKKLTEKSPK